MLWPGMEPTTFWCTGWCSSQASHWPGQGCCILKYRIIFKVPKVGYYSKQNYLKMTWKKNHWFEGEREKHRFVVPFIYAFMGCFLHVPWPGIEPAILAYWDDALTNQPPSQGFQMTFKTHERKYDTKCLIYYVATLTQLVLSVVLWSLLMFTHSCNQLFVIFFTVLKHVSVFISFIVCLDVFFSFPFTRKHCRTVRVCCRGLARSLALAVGLQLKKLIEEGIIHKESHRRNLF